MEPTVIILIVVIAVLVVALVVAGVLLARRRRSEHLQEHFGPEYERRLAETGDRQATEAELAGREKRHRALDIRALDPQERARYEESWNGVQRNFVDDPVRSVRDADRLVVDIMRARGYPVDDFDRRADDISVEHPDVVAHYRAARTVRDAGERGSVDTEDQRGALTSYRALVEALLGDHSSGRRAHDPGRGSPAPRDNHRTGPNPTTEERTR